MESRTLFKLGCRDRLLHQRSCPADARFTQAAGASLSLLFWLALSLQALFTRAIGGRLPKSPYPWDAATIERSHDPRTWARFTTFTGIRTRSGYGVARSRERSRRGLLSINRDSHQAGIDRSASRSCLDGA